MSNLVKHACNEIRSIILSAAEQANIPKDALCGFSVKMSNDSADGEFICDAAAKASDFLNLPKDKIASEISENCSFDMEYINDCSFDSKGLMYFNLKKQWFYNVMQDITASANAYGRSLYGRGKKVLIELISENSDDVLNLRAASLCGCIAKALTLSGYRVTVNTLKYGEYFDESLVSDTAELLQSRELAYQKGNTLWYRISDNSEDDEALITENTATPFAFDISHCLDILSSSEFNLSVIIFSSEHCDRALKLKKAVKMLKAETMSIVPVQHAKNLKLTADLSSEELKFFFNSCKSDDVLDFGSEISSKPLSNILSVYNELCRLTENTSVGSTADIGDIAHLSNIELDIICIAAQYTDILTNTALTLNTSPLAKYISDLATLTDKLFNLYKTDNGSNELTESRRYLCRCVMITLKNALSVLMSDISEFI